MFKPTQAPSVPVDADLEAAFARTASLRQTNPYNARKRFPFAIPAVFAEGLQVSDVIQQSPAILEAFSALPVRFFDPAQLTHLHDLSLAGHHAHRMLLRARAGPKRGPPSGRDLRARQDITRPNAAPCLLLSRRPPDRRA